MPGPGPSAGSPDIPCCSGQTPQELPRLGQIPVLLWVPLPRLSHAGPHRRTSVTSVRVHSRECPCVLISRREKVSSELCIRAVSIHMACDIASQRQAESVVSELYSWIPTSISRPGSWWICWTAKTHTPALANPRGLNPNTNSTFRSQHIWKILMLLSNGNFFFLFGKKDF